MKRRPVVVLLAAVLAASAAYGMSQISRSVTGAGAPGATGASHLVRSTLGQSLAGTVAAASHTLRSGFWVPVTTVSGVGVDGIPTAFRLGSPAPNPFAREMGVSYDVPASAGTVRLRVYDVGGRLVKTLKYGTETPGRKRLIWDGRDDGGNPLPTGVYLLALEAPGYSATRKATLVR
jgi:amino acid transporter